MEVGDQAVGHRVHVISEDILHPMCEHGSRWGGHGHA
jgi:hypothetical protein